MWKSSRSISGSSSSTSDESEISEDAYLSTDESPSSSSPSPSPSPTSSPKSSPMKKLKSALRTRNAVGDAERAAKFQDARTLRFSSTVHICLVLSRTELKPLLGDLFWKPEECAKFKHDAVSELRAHLSANGISAKEAIFELYQPHDHERMQWLAKFDESEKRKLEKLLSVSPSLSAKSDDLCDLDEGYNSEDDDEPRFGSDSTGLNKFSSLKTDVELNNAVMTMTQKALVKVQPKVEPEVAKRHQWAVSWKPKKQTQ